MNSKIDAGLRGELPESFVSHFLCSEGQDFDRIQLLYTVRDLFVAGSDTSSTVLRGHLHSLQITKKSNTDYTKR